MIRAALGAAALFGAAGVALLAVGAHAAGGQATTAGQILLFHAPVLMAGVLALETGLLGRRAGSAALLAIAAGALLFSGDLGARAFLGERLFPLAAPSGGMLMIGGWLAFGFAALIARR